MNLQRFKEINMPVVEIFNSVSGEGISAGSVMTFVRTAGCNLRCNYCDTRYSYDESGPGIKMLKPDDIINILDSYKSRNVLCTGGEPLELNKSKRYLPLYIASKGYKVRIETNGSCPVYNKEEINEYTQNNVNFGLNYALDVKCPDSGMSDYNIYEENFNELGLGDEIKFIVGSLSDIDFGLDIIKKYKEAFLKTGVVINFSPVFGKLHPAEIVEMLKENNTYFEDNDLNVRLSLQIHKFIWPPEARGV